MQEHCALKNSATKATSAICSIYWMRLLTKDQVCYPRDQTHTRKSLFQCVLPPTFSSSQQAMLSTTPTVLLEQILNSPSNLALAERIAKALDWYGSQRRKPAHNRCW